MKRFLTLLLLIPLFLSAQNRNGEISKEKTFGIGIVPQYAIVNGMRIDFDFKLNEKNQWFVVAPQIFLSNNPNMNWEFNSMTGAGIEVQHKIYLAHDWKFVNPYFSYGPIFDYFSVKESGYDSNEYLENGGRYIGLQNGEMTTRIFKTGGNVIFGLMFNIEKLYIDFYAGTGIRFSYDDKFSGLHKYYNDWWGDMGYSGTLMVGGIRFGVIF